MTFIGATGSDTGIINVNGSTSGAGESLEKCVALMGVCADLIKVVNSAEIGAPFGGNKSTGWGRESGGDA